MEFIGQNESKQHPCFQMIGRSRKYSKGHSSSLVQDYRHIVETISESEGFGSSERVDTEMTASANSCAPKRKCITMYTDYHESCGLPMQVLSVSTMLPAERKDKKLRLKMELEQVQALQKKLASINSNMVVLSPSDINSSSNVQKTHPLDMMSKSELLGSHGRKPKRAPGRNGSRTKKGTSGRSDEEKISVRASSSNAVLMNQCEALLSRMMSHQHGWVFNHPVDAVKLNIPDYFTVIKHPMDFGTVKRKIMSGEYLNPLQFAADIRLTFSNALTYNPRGNDVHFMAVALSKYFETRWKAIEKKLPALEAPYSPSRGVSYTETLTSAGLIPSMKKKVTSADCKLKPALVKGTLTDEDKQKLGIELEALVGELPESIIDFLREHSFGTEQLGGDEIEIDIQALSDETLFKVRKLLDDFLIEKRKSCKKVVPCEIEIVNEPGLSNSFMEPSKGNDLVDEDIHVDGNNPLIASYPQVEIEKEAAHGNSSSSSESGSSSSDSGGSGNETDTAKASARVTAAKNEVGPGTNTDQIKSAVLIQDVGAHSLNGSSHVEMTSLAMPITVEADDHQEGESVLIETRVSPEKIYRAALLRNRFADTIIKAREKALEKEPEKLRVEKEELEKRRREEKARLQAEAKAAEESKRKAKAEAVAEAKRKRELEREAAREALQKMEKTVHINESEFMEDLEMLTAVDDECLVSLVEEISPDQSRNGFGSFKFRGSSKPLEQLGLYMKMDEDEEDDAQPLQDSQAPGNDAEEGEID